MLLDAPRPFFGQLGLEPFHDHLISIHLQGAMAAFDSQQWPAVICHK